MHAKEARLLSRRSQSVDEARSKLSTPQYRGRAELLSRNSVTGGTDIGAKVEPMKYTGTKCLGVATMHKSNAVPIFTEDDAKAVSSMRR